MLLRSTKEGGRKAIKKVLVISAFIILALDRTVFKRQIPK